MDWQAAGEDGYSSTAIMLIGGVILISLTLFILAIPSGHSSGQDSSASLTGLTDRLALAGKVTGYADLTTVPYYDPERLAPIGYTGLQGVQLDLWRASIPHIRQNGTGDDLARATVIVTTPEWNETLPRQYTNPFPRPGWTIVSKTGLIPGTGANDNDILEPGEIFNIYLSPSENLAAGTYYTITIALPNVQPLVIERRVPSKIRPSVDMG
jgi:hypothetical protein